MLTSILTGLIFIMGLATVCFSLFVGVSFYRGRRRMKVVDAKYLSDALWLQLFGEAVMGAITVVFAIGAHFGWLEHWSTELQSLMRFTMFLATSLTTWHLYKVVQRIVNQWK